MKTDVPVSIKPNARISVHILHEDPQFLIVEKPSGTVTQPGKGHTDDALLNGVFALRDGAMGRMLLNLGVRRDFGLLHRLDKDTSGLLVVAKTPGAYDQLRRDFESRQVDKEYLAIVRGIPQPRQGVVQARLKEIQVPNADGFGTVKKVVISREGQEAVTAYKVLSDASIGDENVCLVHLDIKTGRLHQIRAHMIFLECQVLGDDLYAPPGSADKPRKKSAVPVPPRLCLHAARLGFKHPENGKWVHFEALLPPDLTAYAKRLGLVSPGSHQ